MFNFQIPLRRDSNRPSLRALGDIPACWRRRARSDEPIRKVLRVSRTSGECCPQLGGLVTQCDWPWAGSLRICHAAVGFSRTPGGDDDV